MESQQIDRGRGKRKEKKNRIKTRKKINKTEVLQNLKIHFKLKFF